MITTEIHTLFTDGGSRENPGNAAAGAVLYDSNEKLVDLDAIFLGKQTNNYAEYKGLILGLKLASKQNVQNIHVFMDSELIIKQMKGEYRIKDAVLKTLKVQVDELVKLFSNVEFFHVRREKNKIADKLVNLILDNVLIERS